MNLVDFPASVIQLENGLTLIHQDIAATPVVVADVWVKAGAAVEPSEWAGMAHFLEHMIFKGTDQLPPGMFDYAIETQGGMTNAATSHDYAHFFIIMAADRLPATLPYLAELLLHAAIPADEFVRERQVFGQPAGSCCDSRPCFAAARRPLWAGGLFPPPAAAPKQTTFKCPVLQVQ